MSKPEFLDDLFKVDTYLKPYEKELVRRYGCFEDQYNAIDKAEGIDEFTTSFLRYGLHIVEGGAVESTEWCPGAKHLFLYGDFNNWNRTSHPFHKIDHGKWSIRIEPVNGNQCPIEHNTVVKLIVVSEDGKENDRISPWATYVTADNNSIYEQRFWNPPDVYKMIHKHPTVPASLRIYEAHIGIASWKGKVSTYEYFKDDLLPRIQKLGYNAIQLMAVMEHAYYASFGYQVTSFFAASSRFGNPEQLKHLIDAAHEIGFVILLDVVHSHASMNTIDGLNEFDGTKSCFFHDNARGTHSQWGSRLFNYSQWEVLRFLLSNLRMWVEVYNFDGFRFDGATSMIYHNHGIGDGVSGCYDDYFSMNVDTESLTYLTLANKILHDKYPFMITIAEEVSGMPALCRPVSEGGQGFDYRLSMGIPDKWIKLLKHEPDEQWSMADICWTLSNRRYAEKHVAYAESHDQALVGDKSLIFWMLDAEMYTGMSLADGEATPTVDRGIALHKMIRLITHSLGGESYLNFIGNEFGHPEWLDFPRKGNSESYHYARRQFNLVDNVDLRYRQLNAFDCAMNKAEQTFNWLSASQAYISRKHESDKIIVFEKTSLPLVFIFNFHPSKSYTDYRIGVDTAGRYKMALCSDDAEFGGHCRLSSDTVYDTTDQPFDDRKCHLNIYTPCRTAIVLMRM